MHGPPWIVEIVWSDDHPPLGRTTEIMGKIAEAIGSTLWMVYPQVLQLSMSRR